MVRAWRGNPVEHSMFFKSRTVQVQRESRVVGSVGLGRTRSFACCSGRSRLQPGRPQGRPANLVGIATKTPAQNVSLQEIASIDIQRRALSSPSWATLPFQGTHANSCKASMASGKMFYAATRRSAGTGHCSRLRRSRPSFWAAL